jgi:O-antigen/teichoic acid export membrane protein
MLTNFFYTSDKINHIKKYNIYRIIFINIFSLIMLNYFKNNSVEIRLGTVYVVEFLIFLVFVKFLISETIPRFDFDVLKKSLHLGLPITLSAIFSIFTNFSDKFFLERFGNLKDLSKYYLALAFASILPIIFNSLQNVWLPVFLKEKNIETNILKTNKLISKLMPFYLALCIGICLLFIFLLYFNIISSKYRETSYVLPILLISQIFATLTALYGNYLIYFEKTYLVSVAGLIVGIVSVSLGFLLVPIWGVYGSAISSLATNFIYLFLYYKWTRRKNMNTIKLNN